MTHHAILIHEAAYNFPREVRRLATTLDVSAIGKRQFAEGHVEGERVYLHGGEIIPRVSLGPPEIGTSCGTCRR